MYRNQKLLNDNKEEDIFLISIKIDWKKFVKRIYPKNIVLTIENRKILYTDLKYRVLKIFWSP